MSPTAIKLCGALLAACLVGVSFFAPEPLRPALWCLASAIRGIVGVQIPPAKPPVSSLIRPPEPSARSYPRVWGLPRCARVALASCSKARTEPGPASTPTADNLHFSVALSGVRG